MNWLLLGLWGGLVGVDATSVLQAMISRPLIAASVTGLLLGHPAEGVAVGILLELFALLILPIGAAKYPEGGTAAVAASAAYIGTVETGLEPQFLLLALVFGLLWERVGAATVTGLRRLNERLVEGAAQRETGDGRRLERRHLAAIGLDFCRGGLVVVAGTLLGLAVLGAAGPLWVPGDGPTFGALGLAATAMLGAALGLFGGLSERRVAFVLGLLCGSILLLAR